MEPGIDKSKNTDVLPPPLFTHMSLPFNYFYSQNPYVRTTADGGTVNVTAVKQVGYFISADDPTPTGPQEDPDVTDARFMEVLADLEAAFAERPIWTRRSLLNHLGKKLDSWNELKKYLNYAAYQFKGGPWRDCVVPYGLDPRTDPKYREYQTVMFKLTKHKRPQGPAAVRTYRRPEKVEERVQTGAASHIFDGETYDTDGKVWQVCDITDPLLRELLDGAAVRPMWDVSSGWYHGGLWAKVKAIMKTKLVAIRFGRRLSRMDFAATLSFGDMTPPRTTSSNLHLPLPNLRLTDEELTALRGRKPPKKKSQGYNVKIAGRATASVAPEEPASMASSPTRAQMEGIENEEESGADSNEDNDSGSELEDEQLDQLAEIYHGPYRYGYQGGHMNDTDDGEDIYPDL